MKAIEVLGLSKSYAGKKVLESVTFDVEAGEAVALIGQNGAGKTTLLRMLATLLKPDAGHAKVLGFDGRFQGSRIRSVLGYMPDQGGMEDDLAVSEYLEYFAGLHGLAGAARGACVEGLLELLDLGGVRATSCGALSRGMQQRVGLARTLVHNPSVLLLDEPAANLDPRARVEIREVLKELRRMGKTILVSSHILAELKEFCTRVLLMAGGRIAYYGAMGEVAAAFTAKRRIAVRVTGDPARLAAALAPEPAEDLRVEPDGWLRLRLREGATDYSFVVRRALEAGVGLLELREEEAGLEEIFLRLTADKAAP